MIASRFARRSVVLLVLAVAAGCAPAVQYPRVVLTFGGVSSGPSLARNIALDNSGLIYVADYGDGRVQVFDQQGGLARQWTTTNRQNVRLDGLAVDRAGTVLATLDGAINRFDGSTGKPLGQVAYDPGPWFYDLATASNGLVATWVNGHDDVIVFSAAGQATQIITDAVSSAAGKPEYNLRVAIGLNGSIFVLGTSNNTVVQYDSNGQPVNHFGGRGDQPGQLLGSNDIAIDDHGRVYVSDDQGIQLFDPTGAYRGVIKLPDNSVGYGLAFDLSGAMFVLGDQGKVYKYLLAPSS